MNALGIGGLSQGQASEPAAFLVSSPSMKHAKSVIIRLNTRLVYFFSCLFVCSRICWFILRFARLISGLFIAFSSAIEGRRLALVRGRFPGSTMAWIRVATPSESTVTGGTERSFKFDRSSNIESKDETDSGKEELETLSREGHSTLTGDTESIKDQRKGDSSAERMAGRDSESL